MYHMQHASHDSSDILNIFFQDVARLPIIGGRNEYLPLTRRIERGRLLLELTQPDTRATLQRIQSALSACVEEITTLEPGAVATGFVDRIAEEVEPFLDNPEWDAPPSMKAILARAREAEHREQLWQACWRGLLLLALLPDRIRINHAAPAIPDEIEAHFQTIRDEYEISKRTLIEGTLRYSIRLARYYIRSGIPYLDLVQEGFLGVITAVDKFQEAAGAHFQSYAAQWIQQRIRRYIADQSRLIRIPVHRHETVAVIDNKRQELAERLGEFPDDNQLFVALEWLSDEDVQLLQELRTQQRFTELRKRFESYRQLFKYRNKPLSEIPEPIRPLVLELDDACASLTEELGVAPDAIAMFHKLEWFSDSDVAFLREYQSPAIRAKKAHMTLSKLRRARNEMGHYRIAYAHHYSLEAAVINDRPITEQLVAPHDTASVGDASTLGDGIEHMLSRLNERESQVVRLRFGLEDGNERTLEEVGQLMGVTRERIRQIESKALRKLCRSAVNYGLQEFLKPEPSRVDMVAEQVSRRLLGDLHNLEFTIDDEEHWITQEAYTNGMIDKHVMQGRTRTTARTPHGSRARFLEHILEQAGEPLHYSIIHERALQALPPHQHYPKERAYAALFYSDRFQLLGNGVFALASWDTITTGATGEKALHHCPQPLLPPAPDGRAFFESIMVGRDILRRKPHASAQEFYADMLNWARSSNGSSQAMQAAFDAWYAAGLLKRVDVLNGTSAALELTIPEDARLNDVRLHCLNSLCRRVLKMPELLLTLKRIARPVVPDIQRVLFGNERAGFDVPQRLALLAAFEAVQHTEGEWRLTPIGEALLQANPPQDLPDFSVIDDVADDDAGDDELAWDDELGLLDL